MGWDSQILSKSKGENDKLEMTGQVLPPHPTHSPRFHLTPACLATPLHSKFQAPPQRANLPRYTVLALTATFYTC